tara:strand:- start:238 stop:459 length:222 start_codon:yes stop_codon:yes gene_type:complete
MTTNWNSILKTGKQIRSAVRFAKGDLSGSEFYSYFKNTEAGGEVRNLLRSGGVNRARQLTRKALSRRMIDVIA